MTEQERYGDWYYDGVTFMRSWLAGGKHEELTAERLNELQTAERRLAEAEAALDDAFGKGYKDGWSHAETKLAEAEAERDEHEGARRMVLRANEDLADRLATATAALEELLQAMEDDSPFKVKSAYDKARAALAAVTEGEGDE